MKRLRRLAPTVPVFYVTILMFVLSAVVQPRSVQPASLNSMLPFAAVLAVASIGQTLVVQQRGIDLSVAGTVTLAAIVVSKYPEGSNSRLFIAIMICLLIGAIIGLLLGFFTTVLGVTPLIATFGMNAIVVGIGIAYASGQSRFVPPVLNNFSTGRVLGIQNLVWLAIIVTFFMAFVMNRTRFGREFDAVGANIDSARASGIRVTPVRWSAYVMSSICCAIAGVMIAGFANVPDLNVGTSYLMPSIAAVVLGGTSFAGGRGHLFGTLIAALLLSQLNQFVLSIGAPTAMQFIVQGAVIAVAAGLQSSRGGRRVVRRIRMRLFSSGKAPMSA